VNEKSAPETTLDLILMQRPHDEDPEPREVRPRLEVEPPQVWYYFIFPILAPW
jgi:hypothetical protein